MEKMNGKLVTFTGIIVLVLLVAIFGFLFWEPKPEYIQGEAEATEVRISGKVPGRIEIFRFNEGEQEASFVEAKGRFFGVEFSDGEICIRVLDSVRN